MFDSDDDLLRWHGLCVCTVSRDELVRHAVTALSTCCADDETLSAKNVSIGVVGPDEKFHVFTEAEVAPFVRPIALAAIDCLHCIDCIALLTFFLNLSD